MAYVNWRTKKKVTLDLIIIQRGLEDGILFQSDSSFEDYRYLLAVDDTGEIYIIFINNNASIPILSSSDPKFEHDHDGLTIRLFASEASRQEQLSLQTALLRVLLGRARI